MASTTYNRITDDGNDHFIHDGINHVKRHLRWMATTVLINRHPLTYATSSDICKINPDGILPNICKMPLYNLQQQEATSTSVTV